MPVLSVAITVLGLSGGPGLPGGPYDHTQTPALRTYSSDFTRLSYGLPGRPYGSFAGKAATSTQDKYTSMSVVPVVSIGEVTDVDVDTTLRVTPVAAMASTVRLNISAAMTVKPVLTQGRGQVNSTGTTNKAAALSVVPVVGLSALVSEVIVSNAQSVIPVLAMSSAVDATLFQEKAAALSVIPVANFQSAVNRINGSQAWDVPFVALPRLTMSSSVKASGEVDHIHITATPSGRIRITKV